MELNKRAEDATNRVMEIMKLVDKRLHLDSLNIIRDEWDEWYDYFYDLLGDNIDDSEFFSG